LEELMRPRLRSFGTALLLLSALSALGVAQAHDPGAGCTHDHGSNKITCNENNNTVTGTSGRDIIWTYGGDDTVNAGAGDDDIHGGGHSDTLRGSDGRDDLFGGGGDSVDRLGGGNGPDDLKDTDGLPPFSAPWSDETDIVCAGTDSHLDTVNVRDDDTYDKIYVDKGEDDYQIDIVFHMEFKETDLVLKANDCPF
jgi:Ca2+-binding RTX toxin-like protein